MNSAVLKSLAKITSLVSHSFFHFGISRLSGAVPFHYRTAATIRLHREKQAFIYRLLPKEKDRPSPVFGSLSLKS